MLTAVEKAILLQLAETATTTQVIAPSLIAALAAEPAYPLPSSAPVKTTLDWVVEIHAALPETPALDDTERRALAQAVHDRLIALGALQ